MANPEQEKGANRQPVTPDLTYVTRGGVTVRRFRRDADYRTAISDYTALLDSQPGVILSSNYEYPGRYTRWDTAIVDPPLVISSHQRAHDDRGAITERGKPLLAMIEKALTGARPHRRRRARGAGVHRGDDRRSRRSRSRRKSARARRRCSRCCAPSSICSTPPTRRSRPLRRLRLRPRLPVRPGRAEAAARPAQRDLVLFLPDEILVVDHHAAKAWLDRYEFDRRRADHRGLPRDTRRSRSQAPTRSRRAATTRPANMPRLVEARQGQVSRAATCSRSCRARCSTSAAKASVGDLAAAEGDQPVALFLLHQSRRQRIPDRRLAGDVRARQRPARRDLPDLGHDQARRATPSRIPSRS